VTVQQNRWISGCTIVATSAPNPEMAQLIEEHREAASPAKQGRDAIGNR
jgi:hypothetical protein